MSQDATVELATTIVNSNNPFVLGLLFVVCLLVLVVFGAPMVARTIKAWKEANSDGQVDDARKVLFEQLQAQVKQNGEDIRQLITEKRDLENQTFELKTEIAHLNTFKELNEVLKQRLQEKDSLVESLREDIRRRDDYERLRNIEFSAMKDRIHELELRLAKDEQTFCAGCQYKPA